MAVLILVMITMVYSQCNPGFAKYPLTLVIMENNLGTRIRKALDVLSEKTGSKKTPNWLANQVGVSRPAAYKWMNNPTAGIDGENLYKVAKALQVSADWLASGKGEMQPEAVSGGYVVANSLEELVRQVKEKGPDEVLQAIRLLAENSQKLPN
ncbi:helix-turn-helix domain-containing protein [Chromobacterium haemolyticum]|uniref:helix-turn-helix domain-containing protein n=1 Tax=Chromobacterium haemolyticum TaxID=394935 RepID=UPI0005BC90FA|nr:helix-turn-helix domain-containing protein [Chromobacterium haemolyticum]